MHSHTFWVNRDFFVKKAVKSLHHRRTLRDYSFTLFKMSKTVLVLGATGTQGKCTSCVLTTLPLLMSLGGSVANLLVQYPDKYIVRCLTRNPDSDKAKKLAALGAQVVKADLTVPSTLPQAFKGVWGIFAVTDFYDTVCLFRSACRMPLTHLCPLRPSSRTP